MKIRSEIERIIIEGQKNDNHRKSIISRPGGIIDDRYPLKEMLNKLLPFLCDTPRFLPMPLFGNGQNKISLISVNDLTKIVVDQLLSNDDDGENKIIELGNPKNDIRYIDLINIANPNKLAIGILYLFGGIWQK